MSLVALSDVHIKRQSDERSKLFKAFLEHEKTSHAEKIILLGDIFDLMVGDHKEYLELHQEIFDRIVELCEKGKKVYYFEGNHDFHLNKLFQRFKKERSLGDSFEVFCQDIVIDYQGAKFYLCHGDNIEIENPGYRLYKSLINNRPMNLVANHLMPYPLLQSIGEFASEKSRKRNQARYAPGDEEKTSAVREKFRTAANIVCKQHKNLDFILAGHSHVQDNYESSTGTIYINNGFTPMTKTFIHITNTETEFVSLN